jgi:hypothetical protein
MLGTKLSKEDQEKAEHILEIKAYTQKMLTKEIVYKIMMKYFKPSELGSC